MPTFKTISENNFHLRETSTLVLVNLPNILDFYETVLKVTYSFSIHFHPYVGNLIKQLKEKSLPGLFDPAFHSTLSEDFFKEEYGPNESDVQRVEVFYPKKELETGVAGSYSIYNWELLFHAPLAIAVHLSKNQRFVEAQRWFHFIFDPTSNDKSVDPPMKFWKFPEFRKKSDVDLINDLMIILSEPEDSEEKTRILSSIEEWRKNPFQPHAIARNRVLAYQFNVVMRYLDNLIAWGDSLFRQDTIESINEATQIYILATNLLGVKPQKIPRSGKIRPKTFAQLKNKLDAFGNALIEMEGEFPFNLNLPSMDTPAMSQTGSAFGISHTLYFCIPQNDKLLGYWDTVADRLFKLRHCMNIEGIVRQLPLFQPPIDPGMLVKAAAAGIDISSVVSGLNQPLSIIRGPQILRKAIEICNEVKSLGSSLLSALEKQDAETLTLLRQSQEIKILELVEDVKFLQWKNSEASTEALLKTRSTTYQRYRHYQRLLGVKEEDLKEIKDISIERPSITQDNFDEIYDELVEKYGAPIGLEEYLEEKEEVIGPGAALHLNSSEDKELNQHMPASQELQRASSIVETIASVLALIPEFTVNLTPLGIGATIEFGGREISTVVGAVARVVRIFAEEENYKGTRAAKLATYQRRLEDFVLQNNLAASELMQIGRQIITSLIGEQIAKKEYENHQKTLANAIEVDTFLQEKFTNHELYAWRQGEIAKLYYECYKFAFDIAKKAEQTIKYELQRNELNAIEFIKFNYWDSGRKGLLSGETLFLDLKRLDLAYHDHNKREYEITKNLSLQQLNPLALLKLKTTGTCEISIPEWLFDLDCPGHYLRRIKSVSVSIPCVVGPYSSINCTLSLLRSTVRQSPDLLDGEYTRDGSEDTRFKDYFGTIQSIVTSNAQNDSGLFETNLRDERYLPFEGAGVDSTWKLDLPQEFQQFDYKTIADVILHIRYTAREGGNLVKTKAIENIVGLVENVDESDLNQLFSLRHMYPTEWYHFSSSDQNLELKIKKYDFPYLTQSFRIKFEAIELFRMKEGELIRRTVDEADLTALTDEIDTNGQSDLIIASDADLLTRDPENYVFLIISYSLEK